MNRKKHLQKQSDETIKIINKGGRILLKKGEWYLHSWTNLAAGWDKAVWGRKKTALEFMDLSLAHAIAKLYKSKVVVVLPKGKKTPGKTSFKQSFDESDHGLCVGSHTFATQALK